MNTSKRSFLRTTALVGLFLVNAGTANAQTASNKPVTFIIPYTGNAADIVLRPLAARLQELWAKPVIVDSRPGANGIIGTQYVVTAPADGTTILFNHSSLIQNVALSKKLLTFDPFKDLKPVALIGRGPVLLAVPYRSSCQNFPDLAKAIKATPVDFSYGSFGAGSTSHIYGEALRAALNVDIPHIAFKGTGPLVQEMMGGRIPLAFIPGSVAAQRESEKSLRVLAAAAPKRLEQFPSVPTLSELGYKGFEASGFWALFIRKDTPKAIADQLTNDVRRVLDEPAIQKRVHDAGLESSMETPEQFAENMKTEYKHWESLIRKFNISNE